MKNHDFHIVSEAILREIERKKALLIQNDRYHLWRSNCKSFLQSESIRHSVSLEIDGFQVDSGAKLSERNREKVFSDMCLVEAYNWGRKNYAGYLSPEFIRTLGMKMDPRKKSAGHKKNAEGFRGDRDFVAIKGADWTPVSPQLLEREINFFGLENYAIGPGLEQAVHAQFHLLRIHPFNDGNGRVSRAVTNLLLDKTALLPVCISAHEKVEYASLINAAAESYIKRDRDKPALTRDEHEKVSDFLSKRDFHYTSVPKYYQDCVLRISLSRMTKEQAEFYDYLALKARDSLNHALKQFSS